MPWMFFYSYDRQQFYDTVVTVTLGWHHRQWLMTHLTAPLSQNKLSLLQRSATFIKNTLKTELAQIYIFSELIVLVYYLTARNIWINHISLIRHLSRYSDWLQAWGFGDRISVGRDFPNTPDRPWGPASFLYKGYPIIPMKREGEDWGWPHTPPRVEVKENVQLHLYSPFRAQWPVLGWTILIWIRNLSPTDSQLSQFAAPSLFEM